MTDAGHILIVEDEPLIAKLHKDYLAQAAFRTTVLDRGDQVLPFLNENTVDLVLLDLMLPGRDGVSVAREIRTDSELPIIMVTARVEEVDRLLGLELGADDYICKPFSPREVVARVKAVLKRLRPAEPPSRQLIVDEEQLQARWGDQTLKLTRVEFGLLKTLARRPGQIYSRDQLMDQIYPDGRIVTDRTIDTHVKNLRHKMADTGMPADAIESVYGVGYRFWMG